MANAPEDNLLAYVRQKLQKGRLYILHAGPGFSGAADRVAAAARPEFATCVIDFLLCDAAELEELAVRGRVDPEAFALAIYAVDNARFAGSPDYRTRIGLLGLFDYWPSERLWLLPDVNDSLFDALFAASLDELRALGDALLTRLRGVENVRLIGPGDTELTVLVSRDERAWHSFVGGTCEHLLPAGEVAARPLSVDGLLDFTGSMIGTVPFGQKYGLIRLGDLRLEFRESRVVSLGGSHASLVADLECLIGTWPCVGVAGEIGIGFHPAVRVLTGRGYQWEERHRGVHLALGSELEENLRTNEERSCQHHIDLVLDQTDAKTFIAGRDLLL